MRTNKRCVAALLGIVAICSCDAPPEPTPDTARASVSTADRAPAKPEIVPVGSDVTSGKKLVTAELARAKADGRTLLVYVGATWCEPCERFKEALRSGKLDAELPQVRFLELDHDQHEALLSEADMKCTSKLIPLFAKPNEDGTCSDQRIEGAIKGEGAVGFIMPKLRALLGADR